jgi:hypothetical protein
MTELPRRYDLGRRVDFLADLAARRREEAAAIAGAQAVARLRLAGAA